MSDDTQPTRDVWFIVISCVSTLYFANSTIIRPDPVSSTMRGLFLYAILCIKTLLLPQVVLFEAVNHFGSAWIIKMRVNDAARRCHDSWAPSAAITDEALTVMHDLATPAPRTTVLRSATIGAASRIQKMKHRMRRILGFSDSPSVFNLKYQRADGTFQPFKFRKWTLAHGHYVLMGGLTVEEPTYWEQGSLQTSTSSELVSVRPQQLFPLLEKGDPKESRFDLICEIQHAQVTQVKSAMSIGKLSVITLRLISFAYFCIRRLHFGLATSPLEALTFGHVFMALMITGFWWHRPPYLSLPVLNLNRVALLQAAPHLKNWLKERALENRGSREPTAVNAYTYSQSLKTKIILWAREQDNGIGLRRHANYRGVVVSSLTACHSAILLFLPWRLTFPSLMERYIWIGFLWYSVLAGSIITILALVDIVARYIAWRSLAFQKRYGVVLDDRPDCEQEEHRGAASAVREFFNKWILWLLSPVTVGITAIVIVAGLNFRQPPEGIYLGGPGDVVRTTPSWFKWTFILDGGN